jgi:ribonuclease HII
LGPFAANRLKSRVGLCPTRFRWFVMAILVGIDEAGYGPLLGPLVVSAAAFSMPDESLNQSLWDILRESVCRKPGDRLGRLAINDSKKLHHGLGDHRHLQRGVLACLAACDGRNGDGCPTTAGGLLGLLEARDVIDMADYPWFSEAFENWPLAFDADDVATAAGSLARNLDEGGMRLLGLWSRPMQTGRFNRMIDAVKNKASVLFSIVAELIDTAWHRHSGENLQIIVDRMGGRTHYRQQLQRLFPDLHLKILKETPPLSSYQLGDDRGGFKIHFLAKADDRHLPVALASMASKYVRELFMEMMNHFFRQRHPQLEPTAGYYEDGMRFLADLEKYSPPTPAWRNLLIRCR